MVACRLCAETRPTAHAPRTYSCTLSAVAPPFRFRFAGRAYEQGTPKRYDKRGPSVFMNVCDHDHGARILPERAQSPDKAPIIFLASNAALDQLLSNPPLQGGVSYFRPATQPRTVNMEIGKSFGWTL